MAGFLPTRVGTELEESCSIHGKHSFLCWFNNPDEGHAEESCWFPSLLNACQTDRCLLHDVMMENLMPLEAVGSKGLESEGVGNDYWIAPRLFYLIILTYRKGRTCRCWSLELLWRHLNVVCGNYGRHCWMQESNRWQLTQTRLARE